MMDNTAGGRKLRSKERRLYLDEEIDEDDIYGRRTYSLEDKLISDRFDGDLVQVLKGSEFTMKWMQRHGLIRPIVFYDKTGLGMRLPSESFKVSDVKQCVGSRRILDVMDVSTQKAMEMSMKDWVKYYESPERDRLLNVISLEFSHTRLDNYVESPTLVRQIDWVDRAWPRHLKECQIESTNIIEKMKYPKVQKYCLMSVAGCYTDFHIDFGGTSVWYHILHGEKIFWLAPPSQRNIDRYVEWTLSANQGDTFLGDALEQCQRVQLHAGYTFIIPSGWIHAVYTPKDSLVFGGNFLHSFNIENQLLASRVEDKTYVPSKFRYPFFSEIMWYVVDRYISCLTGHTYLAPYVKDEHEEGDHDLVHVDETSRNPELMLESGDGSQKVQQNVPTAEYHYDLTQRFPSEEFKEQVHTKPRVPRKAVSDSNSSWESGEEPKKWTHLTTTELKGLKHLVDYLSRLLKLPVSKSGVPKDLLNPEGVLREIKQVLEEHKNDDQELAVTGESVIKWPETTRKKHHKPKLGYKTGKATKGLTSSSIRKRRTRCKKCEACTRYECGECTFCRDMKKFGGPGRMKQTCISRQCMAPVLPSTSVCMICNEEGHHNEENLDDISRSLMECGICWEIVHPSCLLKKFENLENEGIVNEDLPNSWECPRCCNQGKQGHLKPRVKPGSSLKRTSVEDHRLSLDSDGSHEEKPSLPISPVEGKRVVSKKGKTVPNISKWPLPEIKKPKLLYDADIKSDSNVPSSLLSSTSSLPVSLSSPLRDEILKKGLQPLKFDILTEGKDTKQQTNTQKPEANSHLIPCRRSPAIPGSTEDKSKSASQESKAKGLPKRESSVPQRFRD